MKWSVDTRGRKRRWVILAAAALLSCVGLAWACNVPVFRFALERWRPDAYRAVLFHRGELTAADRDQIAILERQQEDSLANLTLRTVDVSQLDAAAGAESEDAALWAAMREASLPALVVQYPAALKIPKPVWAGTPSPEAARGLMDSPVRQELIKRLAEGETAVWLLLESGQGEADDAAAKLLETELEKLESELKLPELTTAPEDALLASTPLKVAFSLLRVRRDDPAEQALVAMLIGSEPDLAERTDPMTFPVYGRGRALWGLIGPGITAKNVGDSAGFLVGACSCEVKELNPGFDLLLSADWDTLLSDSGIPLAAVATEMKQPAEAELVPIPAGATPTETNTTPASPESSVTVTRRPVLSVTILSPWRLLLIGGGLLGLVVIVGLVAFASLSGGRKSPDA
jgi:hypothetical protein